MEYKVLVKPDKVDENASKKAGIQIYMPQVLQEREQWAMNKGIIVAIGGMAFRDGFERWLEPIPKIGSKILYAQYAGANAQGVDGGEYRLINDKDVAAILEE